jgi:SOS-response transcriptional repressor LexA
VKRLRINEGAVSLIPGNKKYPEMSITWEMDFRILRIVVWVIRKAD